MLMHRKVFAELDPDIIQFNLAHMSSSGLSPDPGEVRNDRRSAHPRASRLSTPERQPARGRPRIDPNRCEYAIDPR
jgi:hypothetical protein